MPAGTDDDHDESSNNKKQVVGQIESSKIRKDDRDCDYEHRDDSITISINGEEMAAAGRRERRRCNSSEHSHYSHAIHPVIIPPFFSSVEKLKHKLFEIFFPDDPLSSFKNRTVWEKVCRGARSLFHICHWLPHYNFRLFRSDLIAGITISSLAIPQGINYAKLANLPPIIGLYSSFVPPVIYSFLGSSRHLAVGPTSTAALVMGTMLSDMVSTNSEPELHLRLAFTATFFAGLFQASLGLFRLGFILDFLSKATLIGFMAGVAILVSLQQLKGLLGVSHNITNKMQLVPVMSSLFKYRNEWSGTIIIMGFCFLAFLLGAKRFSSKKPKFFWVSAAAPLTSVIFASVIVFALKTKFKHVPKIGELPNGINPPSANLLYFEIDPYLGRAIQTGIVTGILALTEGIAVGRTFASVQNCQLDGNKEMMAIGVMNVAGSCCSCFVTSGSFSRSAVNFNAGGRTPLSNTIMGIVVLVTLLFLMPLFIYTPDVTLAAIIITAVLGLIDVKAMVNLWRLDKLDFLACSCSFFGVLFVSVQTGLLIAIGVSVFKVILHLTRPNTMILGNIPGTQIYHSLYRYKDTRRVPSFLILGIESPIYFLNSTYLQERILRWIRDEEERILRDNELPLKCVIFDMTAVTAIDTNGLDLISELKMTLDKKSLQLVLVNPVASVMEKLHRSKIVDSFESKGLYLTVEEAVSDISSSWEPLP
ncbi:probable sulfate transporter 3.4 [Humulus lupulus]|uniref:probable sulfate transporter 3.4 n=1 Tax=Humulus lupulus TaxID=3486 RepID=UPI002B40B511|nr:probable sulfate transporter 3.4 [Humulus lupulus]